MRFSEGFKKYFANTSWLMAERIFSMAVSMLVGIYVARYLGPKRFGSLSYAMSFVALFMPLAQLGLDGIVVRELVKRPGERDLVLGTAFWVKFTGAVLVVSVIALVTLLASGGVGYESALVFWLSLGVIFDAFGVFDLYNQAIVKMKYSSIASIVACIASSCFRLYLIFASAGIVWFAVADVSYRAVRVLSLGIMHRMFVGCIYWMRFSMRLAMNMLGDSWPLVFSSLAVVIYMKIDQVMLRYMMDANDVGVYAAAVKISEVWYFVPVLVSQSLFPAIVSARKIGEDECRRRVNNLFVAMAVFSYAVFWVVFLFSNEIVNFLFGKQYLEAAGILRIHIFALLFVAFGVVGGKWLLVENYTRVASVMTISGAVVNVIANILLIPRFGAIGAAWATVASYAVAGYLFDAVFGCTRWMVIAKTKSLLFVGLDGGYV